ncbi:MAG: pseudouridine synthase [Crocinitomicaceae bacterium]
MDAGKNYILHKPFGYLSQFISNGKIKKKHKFLGELYDFPDEAMAIGRLDLQSEGLLFVTTKGMTSHEVRSAKYEKEYWVQVDGEITDEALEQLQSGVEITTQYGPYITKNCQAKKIQNPGFPERNGRKVRDDRHGPTTWISIVLTEGKFRQVRKMTAAVNFPTLRLVRWRIGSITLENLKLGEVQEVARFTQ